MGRYFIDLEDDDVCIIISDDLAIASDNHTMMRIDDKTAMDMDTGELHMISSWENEEEDA